MRRLYSEPNEDLFKYLGLRLSAYSRICTAPMLFDLIRLTLRSDVNGLFENSRAAVVEHYF